MPKFKGFSDYIEIFRGGSQVDSSGYKHDGDSMIDKAVTLFSSESHEPPLVAGHPKDDAPAYGWVESLKSEDDNGTKVLLARFKEVMPEFEELVKDGRYKKRSAAFYPDGSLRHVGFLGASPPAVKGLADIAFAEGEPVSFEFYDYQAGVVARLFGRIREFLIEEKGVEAADRIIPDWDVDTLKDEVSRSDDSAESLYSEHKKKEDDLKIKDKSKTTDTGSSFTEADLEAAKQAGKEAAQAEFEEQTRQQKKEAAKDVIAAFCGKAIKDGGPLPAWVDGGLKEFMEGLDSEASFEFSEGTKQTSLEWFTGFLESLPQTVNFKEHAKPGDEISVSDDAEDIAKAATEFKEAEAKAGRVISFTQAVNHVKQS